MNILIINTRIFPDYGGPAVFSYNSGIELAKAGNVIHFLTTTPPIGTNRIKNPTTSISFHYLPLKAPAIENKIAFIPKFLFLLEFVILGFLFSIFIIKKDKIKIILAHNPNPAGLVAFLLKQLFNIPYIYLSHSMDYGEKFNQYIDGKLIHRYADHSFLIASRLSKFLSEGKKWDLMVNAVNTSRFNLIRTQESRKKILEDTQLSNDITPSDFIILYIGYMVLKSKAKGMVDFIRALKEFLEKIPNQEGKKIKLLFVGEGYYKFMLEDCIRKYNLSGNVFLLGQRKDIPQLCAISDVGALTSYSEGMPTTLLEMMASGIPCIASNIGEIPRIIENVGVLIRPGDINGIKAALEQFYLHPDLRKTMGDSAKKRIIEHFSWNIVVKKYYDASVRILKSNGRSNQ